MRLREAREADMPAVLALINGYAARNLLLRRSQESLRRSLADFLLAEVDGAVVGCAALSELGPGLGEVRSLAVHADHTGRGVAHALIARHLDTARGRGFTDVLALTRSVSLFEKLGFQMTERERFLDKLAADCKDCPLAVCCDETAVARKAPETRAALTPEVAPLVVLEPGRNPANGDTDRPWPSREPGTHGTDPVEESTFGERSAGSNSANDGLAVSAAADDSVSMERGAERGTV